MTYYSIYSNDDLQKSQNCNCGKCGINENLKPIWHSLRIGFTDKLEDLKKRFIPKTMTNPVIVEFGYSSSNFHGQKIVSVTEL